MSAVSAPMGLVPAYHPSGTIRQDYRVNGILSTYGTAIYTGTPVKNDTNGTLIPCSTGAETMIGVFQGCEFSAGGKFFVSPYWPASQAYDADGTMQAYFTSDAGIRYNGQCDGSVALSAVGEGINLVDASTGSTYTGQSTQRLNHTTTGATPGIGTIVAIPEGLFPGGTNLPGDTFTWVTIKITPQVPVA